VVTVEPTVGQTGTYTLNVTDTGPSTAKDLVVSDELPDFLTATSATGTGWTCTISGDGSSVECTRASLASGATAPIVLQVAVGDPGVGVPVINTATVDAATPDPDPTNNTSSVSVVPLRVLDSSGSIVDDSSGSIPTTGAEIRRWLVLADLFLILGVAVLLGEPTRTLRRAWVARPRP
jgi:uncharacterized repeat protein (TIGR01451 family)